MIRLFLRFASFAFGFLAMVGVVKFLLADDDRGDLPDSIQPKFDFFALHKDEFDTIFIGSSHIAMQIDPISFDAQTERMGAPTRSFNFGFGALTLYEVDLLLRKIERLEPARLRWCIIDALGWGTVLGRNDTDAYTERSVWWHTPRHTARVVQGVCMRELPGWKKLGFIRVHLGHFLYRTTSLGSGVVGRIGGFDRRNVSWGDLGENRGFSPILRSMTKITVARMAADRPEALNHRRHEDHVSALIEDNVEDRAHSELLMRHVTPGNRARFAGFESASYARLTRTVTDLGFTPIYLVPPRLYLFDRYKPEPTLDFSDPKRYPQYFSIFNRNDVAHLTPDASRWYSVDVATEFVKLIGKK